jgi:hypothetical protein
MDSETSVILLVIGIVFVTILVVWWQKTEPPSGAERRSRATRRSERSVPLMGRINVPCDHELLGEYVKALNRERIHFQPPAEPEPPMPYPYGSYHRTNRCFILVSKEDYERAEQIIAEVDRRFYL